MRVFIAILLVLGFAATDLRAQDRPARDDRERPDKSKAEHDVRADHDSAHEAADTGATIGKDDDEPATQPLSCWDRPGGCTGPPQPLCVPPQVWNVQRASCVPPATPRRPNR